MPPLTNVESLVTRIYDAALSTDLWPDILIELADYSSADAAHLFIIDGNTGSFPWGSLTELIRMRTKNT